MKSSTMSPLFMFALSASLLPMASCTPQGGDQHPETHLSEPIPAVDAPEETSPGLIQPEGFTVYYGAERIDLYWSEPVEWHNNESWLFEVEARSNGEEEFARIHDGWVSIPAYTHFAEPGVDHDFRVRMVDVSTAGEILAASPWSEAITAHARPMDDCDLLDEVQRASFRYFWNYRHPVSGLPREGIGGWNRNMCSAAATGMMFFNVAVGIERGWITREEGLEHMRHVLDFLSTRTDRFYGVFPHWIHGETGKTIPFSEKDDGADLVETAFLISGALFAREYVRDDPSLVAAEIRNLSQGLWEAVNWSWFVKKRPDGRRPLVWHWSPQHGFAIDLEIVGFNESQIVYLLGMASPTYPIDPVSYFNGWIDPGYGHQRNALGVALELGRESYGPPLFFAHYSYLGIHPSVFHYGSKNYFEHFQDFCRVQVEWADRQHPELGGGIWGLTASMNPDGYGVHYPGHDNGTITPTAFLASMPYAPEQVSTSLDRMYRKHAAKFWGPFGFRDAMNVGRNWYSEHYIAINVGPIAPMIENYLSGLGWNTLMQAEEIKRAIALAQSPP
ncbi:MAG TPA: glucoamylase family protein [Kiritimatiellia bacterium]|nr:glucoamylase family protein [Kiritimatiellia bacterium]